MKRLSVILVIVAWGLLLGANDLSDALQETRACGVPTRTADGRIIRRADVLRAFEKIHPRPQDGRRWYKDHVIPLACGGCDSIHNLQWLPEEQWREKSKWERVIYGGHKISLGCP